MSLYQEFGRLVVAGIAERQEAVRSQIESGMNINTIEAYRERVGELRAYREALNIIDEAHKIANQRTS